MSCVTIIMSHKSCYQSESVAGIISIEVEFEIFVLIIHNLLGSK